MMMSEFWFLAVILFVGVTGQADEVPLKRLVPRADFTIATPDFKTWGQAVATASKQPTEVAKDSVDLLKDSVKMGSGIGIAAIGKGLNLTKEGVASVTDLGKMAVNMGTTIANQTLGIVGRVGNMIPVAGVLVTSSVGIGQSGVTQVKSVANLLLDSINSWLGGGLGLVSSATNSGSNLVDSAADTIGSVVNAGLDFKADTIGSVIEAGFNALPTVNVNASVNVG